MLKAEPDVAPGHACACVVLAAGGSRRLGTPKQMLRMQGETLLHRAARLAIEAGATSVCVVLGHEAAIMHSELSDLPVLMEENVEWQQGMAGSLKAGIARLQAARPGVRHAMVMVCDQVGITVEHLRRLRGISSANPDCIVATAYADVLGVPAVFPAALFEALFKIDGDRGARGLLEALQSRVVACAFSPGLQDIDTVQDARDAGLL